MNTPLSWALGGIVLLSLAACNRPEPAPEANAPAATPGSSAPSASDAGASSTAPTGEDPGADPAASTAAATRVQWQCGDKPVTAVFDPSGQGLQLQFDATTLTLAPAQSASGARYADANGNEFWEHQGEATLSLAGGKATPCRQATDAG